MGAGVSLGPRQTGEGTDAPARPCPPFAPRLDADSYGLASVSEAAGSVITPTRLDAAGALQLSPAFSESAVDRACSPFASEKVVVLVRLGASMSLLSTPPSEPVVRNR